MKNIAIILTFIMALSSPLVGQDFFKGYAAYEAGDYEAALKEWRPLAEAGDASSQVLLGNMYFEGNGVKQNTTEFIKWYRLAAEQGDTITQERLGSYYLFGSNVVQDFNEAVKWLELAAAKGNYNAQFNLGHAHYKGHGVIQDYITAHMWWNISASNGAALGGMERDNLANQMTVLDISKAQAMARKCMSSNYKECGY